MSEAFLTKFIFSEKYAGRPTTRWSGHERHGRKAQIARAMGLNPSNLTRKDAELVDKQYKKEAGGGTKIEDEIAGGAGRLVV